MLRTRVFGKSSDLERYINKNGIKRSQIQNIITENFMGGSTYTLIWWE